MGLVRALLVVAVVLSALLSLGFIFLVGEVDGDTVVDSIYRWLLDKPPRIAKAIVKTFGGEWGLQLCGKIFWYAFKTNNCLVQVFYLIVMCGGYALWCYGAHPWLPNEYLSEIHKTGAFLSVGICLILFVICSASDPGRITADNVEPLLELYPFDNLVFKEGQACSSCELKKPARSKHCSLCDHCVIRFDHHCVWIGNDVGALNQRWFLLFLLAHGGLCTYGAIVFPKLMAGVVMKLRLWDATFVEPSSGTRHPASWSMIFQYMVQNHLSLCTLCMLCTIFSVLMICFSLWHFRMAFWLNRTTNESFKRISASGPNETPKEQQYADSMQSYSDRTKSLDAAYNRGLWQNFKEVMFPHKYLLTKWDAILAGREKEQGQSGKKKPQKAEVANKENKGGSLSRRTAKRVIQA